MSSKYYKAISEIKVEENEKEELIRKLKNNKNNKNKRVKIMTKVRKIFTTIGAITAITVCGGVAYAGLTGNLKLFNNKVDKEYENYNKVVKEKYVENELAKIELESVACDDSYLILDYKVNIKQPAKEIFNNINLDTTTGFEMNFDNTLIINGKTIDKIGSFSQKIVYKITDEQAKVYEIIDLTSMNIPNRFELEISNFELYGNEMYDIFENQESIIKVNEVLNVNISKEEATKDTKIIIPQQSEYNYDNLKLKVEKIVKTPFETFITIKTEERNISNKRFPSNRNEDMIDLYIDLYREKDQIIKTLNKSKSFLKYEDGSYFKDDEGNIIDLNYITPDGQEKFKNGIIYSNFVLATDDRLDNLDSCIIKPYYKKFKDNGDDEEEHLNSLKWYDIKNEQQQFENNNSKITITKIEVKEDRILFYYNANDQAVKREILVKNKDRAFNYFNTDIEEKEISKEEYVVGIRTKNNASSGMQTYENGDTYKTADPEKYDNDTYFTDISKLKYTVDLEDIFTIEPIGEGITINLK